MSVEVFFQFSCSSFSVLFCFVGPVLVALYHVSIRIPKAGPSRFHLFLLLDNHHFAMQGLRRLALSPLKLLECSRLQLQRRRLFHLGFEFHKSMHHALVRDQG